MCVLNEPLLWYAKDVNRTIARTRGQHRARLIVRHKVYAVHLAAVQLEEGLLVRLRCRGHVSSPIARQGQDGHCRPSSRRVRVGEKAGRGGDRCATIGADLRGRRHVELVANWRLWVLGRGGCSSARSWRRRPWCTEREACTKSKNLKSRLK